MRRERITIQAILDKAERTPPLLKTKLGTLRFCELRPEPDYRPLAEALLLQLVPNLEAGRVVEREMQAITDAYVGVTRQMGGVIPPREAIAIANDIRIKVESAIGPHMGLGV